MCVCGTVCEYLPTVHVNYYLISCACDDGSRQKEETYVTSAIQMPYQLPSLSLSHILFMYFQKLSLLLSLPLVLILRNKIRWLLMILQKIHL